VNYYKAIERRQADTGRWFLENENFSNWKTSTSSFLWLYGIPGCGKTVLCSTILETVLEYRQQDIGKAVAYFYFDFTDPKKQDVELMVFSLISQLLQQCVKLPTAPETLYVSCGGGKQQPSLYAALEALREMIQAIPHTYFVLDALDECADRKTLLNTLRSIVAWKLGNLHILLTSRKERDIETSLESFVDSKDMICLQSKLVDPDIQTYVCQRLSEDPNLKKWQKDDTIREEIKAVLLKGAHGMYVLFLLHCGHRLLTKVTGFDGQLANSTLWKSVAMSSLCAICYQHYHPRWIRHMREFFAPLIRMTQTTRSVS
jgi:hypothetical protein